jgi:hypothetical protein
MFLFGVLTVCVLLNGGMGYDLHNFVHLTSNSTWSLYPNSTTDPIPARNWDGVLEEFVQLCFS